MMRATIPLLIALLVACTGGEDVGSESTNPVAGKPTVYTVNYPLAWVAEQLGGGMIEVHFPAPADVDPAFWKPDADALAGYQGADLVLLNGSAYAGWQQQASLPITRLLDTTSSFAAHLIQEAQGPVHSHGPEGEHSHKVTAFTTWLDPVLLGRQAMIVADGLRRLEGTEQPEVDQRLEQLAIKLAGIDEELKAVAQALDGAPVLYSHPVYQYLQRRYNLNGHALHWEPHQLPDAREWQALELLLGEHSAKIMLWEDEPLAETRAKLDGLGVAVVVFPPLGNRPAQGDYLENMQQAVARLAAAVH